MNILKNTLKNQYSQIPNELITDLTLSAGELRVLLYLFTKPDNWTVYNKDVCNQLGISEKTLSKYWKTLITSRWLRRERSRDKKGVLLGGYSFHIGNFDHIGTNTISEECSLMEESSDHSNNKPINKQVTNTNTKSDLPENLNAKAWDEWISYKGKAYKKASQSKMINKLIRHSKDIQQEMVEISIMNGWKGLFELKQQNTFKNKQPEVNSIEWHRQQNQNQENNLIDVEVEA